ncbi:MAG TPA: hypothetical protein VGP68_17155 [Gemmataceae bacterium]|nr:hypothetical protein [Gemmataceae bacterium]
MSRVKCGSVRFLGFAAALSSFTLALAAPEKDCSSFMAAREK